MRTTLGKILRILAILLLGLTAFMNILGGAGTSCVAFNTAEYPDYAAVLNVQWLYQGFVITTVAAGLAGIWAIYRLLRSKENAYRYALIVLGVGTALGATHYFTSMGLLGKAAPANMKFYINTLTLVIFLVLGLPGLREKISFDGGDDSSGKLNAAGLTAFTAGLLVLSTPMWTASSHTIDGFNFALYFPVPLLASGIVLSLLGLGLLVWAGLSMKKDAQLIVAEKKVHARA
jgi:hypothetical protein